MYGATFDNISFSRVKTNLILIAGIILIIIIKKIKSIQGKKASRFLKYFFIFLFLNILGSLFAINVERSLWLSIISVLGPLLFYIVLMKIPSSVFSNIERIVISILKIILVFFILGFIFYYYQLSRGLNVVGVGYLRGGGGIWMSNISTQIMSLFYPLIFTKTIRKKRPFIFYIFIFFFFTFIVVSLSRTSTVVYSLFALFFIFKSNISNYKKVGISIIIVGIVFLFSNIILPSYGVSVNKLYESRFEKKGSVIQTTLADERLQLSKLALDKFLKRPIFGYGIGNFVEINKPGYTNSHNIFTNILVERGIFSFLLFFSFIIFYLRLSSSNIRQAKEKGNSELIEFSRALKYGLILFLLIGLTTNDLFVSSGFVNAWPSYIIVFLTVIQLNLYAIYHTSKRYIK